MGYLACRIFSSNGDTSRGRPASALYRTTKLGIESGTIPTVQLGQRLMIPRVPLLRVFGVKA